MNSPGTPSTFLVEPASKRLQAQQSIAETAVLRRIYCLENLLADSEKQKGLRQADFPVASAASNTRGTELPGSENTFLVNRSEGYVQLLLPLGGTPKLVRMNLLGMTDKALRTYAAIHAKLAQRLSESHDQHPASYTARTSGERDHCTGVNGEGNKAVQGTEGSHQRESFFSALHYVPPSVPLKGRGDDSSGDLSVTPSPTSSVASEVAPSAAVRKLPHVTARQGVEIVEIMDTLATSQDASPLSQPEPVTVKDKLEPIPREQAAPSTLGKQSEATLDDDEDANANPTVRETSTPPRFPSATQVTHASTPSLSASQGSTGAKKRSRTPSQVQREVEEFFPSPVVHRSEASDTAAAAAAPVSSLRTDGISVLQKGTSTDEILASVVAIKQEPKQRGRKASKRKGAPAQTPVSHGPGVGRDVLATLYTGTTTSVDGLSAQQIPSLTTVPDAPPKRREDGIAALTTSSHVRTEARRAQDYQRFVDAEAYAERTYGVVAPESATSTPTRTADGPAPPHHRPSRAAQNTPRQFWDITFAFPTQATQTSPSPDR